MWVEFDVTLQFSTLHESASQVHQALVYYPVGRHLDAWLCRI